MVELSLSLACARQQLGRLLPLSCLAVAVSACGPITATSAIAEARVAIEAAQGAEAPKLAVFEYVSAVEYHRKAREEEGYSDFQAAVNLAKLSKEFAEKARERALGSPERGLVPATPGTTPSPTELTPTTPSTPSGSHL